MLAAPMKFVPNPTRKPSFKEMVRRAPTVGPTAAVYGRRRLRAGAALELRRVDAMDRVPIGIGFAVVLALIVGYPCFRLKVVGHYFALVTLALSQVVMLSIVAGHKSRHRAR